MSQQTNNDEPTTVSAVCGKCVNRWMSIDCKYEDHIHKILRKEMMWGVMLIHFLLKHDYETMNGCMAGQCAAALVGRLQYFRHFNFIFPSPDLSPLQKPESSVEILQRLSSVLNFEPRLVFDDDNWQAQLQVEISRLLENYNIYRGEPTRFNVTQIKMTSAGVFIMIEYTSNEFKRPNIEILIPLENDQVSVADITNKIYPLYDVRIPITYLFEFYPKTILCYTSYCYECEKQSTLDFLRLIPNLTASKNYVILQTPARVKFRIYYVFDNVQNLVVLIPSKGIHTDGDGNITSIEIYNHIDMRLPAIPTNTEQVRQNIMQWNVNYLLDLLPSSSDLANMRPQTVLWTQSDNGNRHTIQLNTYFYHKNPIDFLVDLQDSPPCPATQLSRRYVDTWKQFTLRPGSKLFYKLQDHFYETMRSRRNIDAEKGLDTNYDAVNDV